MCVSVSDFFQDCLKGSFRKREASLTSSVSKAHRIFMKTPGRVLTANSTVLTKMYTKVCFVGFHMFSRAGKRGISNGGFPDSDLPGVERKPKGGFVKGWHVCRKKIFSSDE